MQIDIAQGVAEFDGTQMGVAIAVITHMDTGRIIWQSEVAVPFQVEDWLERCMTHLRTLHSHMDRFWPEVAVELDWWMYEPGDNEDYPHGLWA